MAQELKIIIIEESEEDLLQILKQLEKTPFQIGYKRVKNHDDLVQTLQHAKWDMVICNYILDGFNALKAIKFLKEQNLTLPVIIISERIGEENAVLSIKSGAEDYVLKDNLSRLPVVVERAVKPSHTIKALNRPETVQNESYPDFRQIIENTDEAVFIEQNGRIKYFNKRAAEIFDKSTLLTENFSIKDLLVSELMTGTDPSVPPIHRIIKRKTKSGQIKWLEIRSLELDWEGSTAILYFVRDISAQKSLESRLHASQRLEAIGTLAGGLAHDFNNILSPILGYTELVLDDLDPDSLAYKNISQVYKAANRAKELVQQILTFSRQSETEQKPLRIQVIVKEALKFLRASIPSTIDFNLKIDDNCRPVMANPDQIHQLILNLCTNAYQAMYNRRGLLSVNLSENEINTGDPQISSGLQPGHYIELSVGDSGHGMDNELIQHIFEPFFTTRKQGQGSGMGLSVVHGIVKEHKGYIDVQSEPDKGSTFNIFLPLIKEEKISLPKTATQSTLGGTEHIFLVDDEKDIVFLIKQMLESFGYQVTTRTASLEALEAFENQPEKYDLVITDQSMPNMTGEELARRLTSLRPQIPVLLCTGFSDYHDKEELRATGIVDVILKPVLKNDLARAVRQALDKNKL